jgi:molybdenum cofactor cytidylyltransferase
MTKKRRELAMRPTVVVLAAGRGTRFAGGDGHKLAQPLAGDSVLGRTLRNVLASRLPFVVVTTSALSPLARAAVPADDVVLLDDSAPFGMGHSIAAGVAARPHADGWLVQPGDMPLVQPQTLLAVAQGLAEHHAVAYAQHRGRRGHPVAFGSELFSELIMLGGDEGARRLIARYPAHAVEVEDPGVLVDVDTVADLQSVTGAQPAPQNV